MRDRDPSTTPPLDLTGPAAPQGFTWLHPPAAWRVDGGLHLTTAPRTDLWQRTHYGFRRDDGHVLGRPVRGEFSLEARVRWTPRAQYDQCGLMARAGPDCWVKCSVEYEDERHARLGSVVTNLGFSDWATQDVSGAVRAMRWRLSRRGDDVLVEAAPEGGPWQQVRVAHLHGAPEELLAGVYACSPVGEGFDCTFDALALGPCAWPPYSG